MKRVANGEFLSQGLQSFHIYILQKPSGRFYVGSTDDVARRMREHNEQRGTKTSTRKNGPWGAVWTEPYPTRAAAMT
jgi:predicted GIY-YIG superfamily endonuclease